MTLVFSLGASIARAQVAGGAASDQPSYPWNRKAQAADTMISEAQKTIQRCNEQIAKAEEMKKIAQEGRAKAQRTGGTSADQPEYPWLSMEQAADQMIMDARHTIARCELQIKLGKQMKIEAENEIKKMGQ
jgi:hypothetical protein